MTIVQSLVLFIAFFLFELLYFRIARKFQILDIPNHRSAHQKVTIRGIGILFPIAILVYFFTNDYSDLSFVLGLVLISTISFMDDIQPLANRYRILVQFLSVGILFLGLFQDQAFIGFIPFIGVFILSVGIINAYNFMDGINGITGVYSLLFFGTLYYIQATTLSFIEEELLVVVGISLLVFLFFNFRKRAVGFGGDVGSVSLAFIVIFCLGKLILASGQWKYLFLLSIYGIDTIYTIIFRLINRENIFKAHKLHFFQILVHEYKWGHLWVSTIYVLAQFFVSYTVISSDMNKVGISIILVLIVLLVHLFRIKANKGIGFTEK